MFSLKSMVSACVILHVAYGAAIPMWELLSKDEKVSVFLHFIILPLFPFSY